MARYEVLFFSSVCTLYMRYFVWWYFIDQFADIRRKGQWGLEHWRRNRILTNLMEIFTSFFDVRVRTMEELWGEFWILQNYGEKLFLEFNVDTFELGLANGGLFIISVKIIYSECWKSALFFRWIPTSEFRTKFIVRRVKIFDREKYAYLGWTWIIRKSHATNR